MTQVVTTAAVRETWPAHVIWISMPELAAGRGRAHAQVQARFKSACTPVLPPSAQAQASNRVQRADALLAFWLVKGKECGSHANIEHATL